MPLFIPTSSGSDPPFSNIQLIKGQLYNLDLNEFIGFQFNPREFVWTQNINWSEIIWNGDFSGGDLYFINRGPVTFDLSLLYIANPGTPNINYDVPENIVPEGLIVEFEQIRVALERWTDPVSGLGRSSRIRVIIGPNYFDIVMTSLGFRIGQFFEDLSAQESSINIGCREWLTI